MTSPDDPRSGQTGGMSDTGERLDPMLLEILVCPEDKGELDYLPEEGILLNRRLSRTYAVRGGIPVMLIEESTTVDEAELARLIALADS